MKKILLIVSMILICTLAVFGENIIESIEVYRNKINVEVNGEKTSSDNFLFENRTYVQLNEIASKLGADVSWNGDTKTASINNNLSDSTIQSKSVSVDVTNPIIEVSYDLNNLESITLLKNNNYEQAYFAINDHMIKIVSIDTLNEDNEYSLIISLKSGQKYNQPIAISRNVQFTYTGDFKTIYVPAYPKRGFNYGFFITLPSDNHKSENSNKKRYLLVEPNNTGRPDDNEATHYESAKELANKYNTYSIAESLWLPRLIPTFPRPMSVIGGEMVYTHDLTRNTILLEDLIKKYPHTDYDFESLVRIDVQLNNMIDYAQEILANNDQAVEEKIFMWGFSASGGFVNKYVYLHPEKVKAAIYAGPPMLPLETYKGEELFYPHGISDYEKITGKAFDINAYNNVAKFFYMGTNDHNNDTLAHDIYNAEERALINKVFHAQEYPNRWDMIVEAYIESEATAQIFEYIGAQHQTFYKSMPADYRNFFNANRDSEKPVYIQPSTPSDVNVMYLGK